jgi:hypothetical protein
MMSSEQHQQTEWRECRTTSCIVPHKILSNPIIKQPKSKSFAPNFLSGFDALEIFRLSRNMDRHSMIAQVQSIHSIFTENEEDMDSASAEELRERLAMTHESYRTSLRELRTERQSWRADRLEVQHLRSSGRQRGHRW